MPMPNFKPYLLAGLVPVVFVFALASAEAPQAAAATNCAAVPVPDYNLSTAALCTTTAVTLSGASATITSSTVRQDASGIDQGLPPSNWGIASDIKVYIDNTYYCGSSIHTATCFVANLSGGPHQFQTNWVGSAGGQTMSTTNYDSFTIALPNLTVSSITPIGTPTANQSFAIQAVITNNGTATAASSWAQTAVGVQGSSNAAISGFTTPALAAGSSYAATFSYTPAVVGTYSINVCADVNGNVVELNENPNADNCKTVSATVSAPAVTPVAADLKSNGADGPLTIGYRQSVPLSWISTNATSCSVLIPGMNSISGGPSGSMIAGPLESSGVVVLTCTSVSGATGSDTLTVNVASAPTPAISNVFAAPSTIIRGDYLTITIVGEEFGANPGVLEEMTGYGGTVKNSYLRGEYNKWDLTWSNTQIVMRIYPSVTQTFTVGTNTVYVRVANQFNQRSTVQPVTATVNPGFGSALAPTLTEVYVGPRPGIRGQTATVFFNGVLNADYCTFQYKGTGEAAWGSATTGSCTSGATFTVPADLPRGLYLLQGRACRNDGTCSEYRQMVGEWQINPSPTEPAVISGRAIIDGFRVITPDTLLVPASTSAAPTTNVRITATLRQALNASLYYPCRAGVNVFTATNVQLACNDETTNTFPLSNDSGGLRTVEVNVLVSNAVANAGIIEVRLNTVGLDGVRVFRAATFTLAGGGTSPPASPTPPAGRASINAFSFTYGSFTRSHPAAVNQSIVSVPSGASVSFTSSYTLAGSTASDWLDLGCQNDNVVNVTINGVAYCRQGANVPYRNPILSNPFTAILTNPSTTQTSRVVLVLRVSDRQGIQEASLPLDVLPAVSGSATPPPPATGSITFTADDQTNLTLAADQTVTFRVTTQGTVASATFECFYNPGSIALEFNSQRYCVGAAISPVPIGLSIFPAQVTFRNSTSQLQQVVAVIKAKDAAGNVVDQEQVVVNVNPLATTGTASQTQSQTQAQSQTSPSRSSARPLVRMQNDDRVFAIINGQRFWIPDQQTFQAAGYQWSDVRVVAEAQVNQYARLRLVRAGSDPGVYYITESGLRRPMPSPAAFASYGNRWEDVASISQAELDAYPSVQFIRAIGDSRVYRLENGQKRWVKTADVFQRLSGRWNEIAPVNATEFGSYPLGADIE